MSGLPWIPLDTKFPTGEHAIALGVALQNPMAWAHVVRLWTWAADNRADGRVEGPAAVTIIETAAGWTGTPGQLVEALTLRHIGLLDVTERGFYIHNWHIHCGAHIEKREKDRRRKRVGGSGNPPRKLRGNSTEPRRNSTQEKEREKEKDQKQEAGASPRSLDVMAEAWRGEHPAAARLLDDLAAADCRLSRPTKPSVSDAIDRDAAKLGPERALAVVLDAHAEDPKPYLGWYAGALHRAASGGGKPKATDLEPWGVPRGAGAKSLKEVIAEHRASGNHAEADRLEGLMTGVA